MRDRRLALVVAEPKKLRSRPGKLKEIDITTSLKEVSESQDNRGESWEILGNSNY
jgi:hypothetical protein